MRVDKAGLRFYFYLFPFLMANIFILKVFTTVLQTAKKKKKRERVSLPSLLLLFFIQINFFRVCRIAGFYYFRQIVVIDRDENLKTKGLKLIFTHLDIALCQKSISINPGHLNILRKEVRLGRSDQLLIVFFRDLELDNLVHMDTLSKFS